MDKLTRKALKGSIKKWEDIASGIKADHGTKNCPLCAVFIPSNCTGCPVNADNQHAGCSDTPYEDFACAFSYTEKRTADTPERKELALKEVEFLKSLLPVKGENNDTR